MAGETRYAYRPGKTFMHSLDPLSKMIWIVCLSFMIIILRVVSMQIALYFVILFSALFLARLSPRFVWRFSRYIYFLGSLMFIMQSLFVPGEQLLWEIGPFTIFQEGFSSGIAVGLRVINLASASMIFLTTTSPRDLAIACTEKLKLPARATQALFLALRFLPLLEDEYADLQDAHSVRGAGAGNGIRDRLQRWQRFTVPFLFSALQRAQVTALAMDSKAFGAFPTKTFYHQVEYPLRGKIFSAFWIFLLLLSIYLLLTGQLNIAGDIFMA